MAGYDPLIRLNPEGRGSVALTCEHASNALPPWLSLGPGDAPWMQTHWAFDLGGAAVTRQLVELLDAPAILANFSRLVCDANRSPGDSSWIREAVEGHGLGFNRGLTGTERLRRARTLYAPYHAAVDAMLVDRLARRQTTFLFSVHTFTANYRGQRREMQAGVLFDLHDDLGERFADGMRAGGLKTAINGPWSGKQGLAYSPDRHGRAHRLPYLEIELRQDLLSDVAGVRRVSALLADLLADTPGA
jgi:predicted N-formylglutamate amidohydrolase